MKHPDWRGKCERRFNWRTFRREWGRWCYQTNCWGETRDYWWEWEHTRDQQAGEMKTPRSLVYMAHATLAFLLAAAVVVGGMWGLMEMVKPKDVPPAKIVNAEWMGGVRRHANGIYREGL